MKSGSRNPKIAASVLHPVIPITDEICWYICWLAIDIHSDHKAWRVCNVLRSWTYSYRDSLKSHWKICVVHEWTYLLCLLVTSMILCYLRYSQWKVWVKWCAHDIGLVIFTLTLQDLHFATTLVLRSAWGILFTKPVINSIVLHTMLLYSRLQFRLDASVGKADNSQ